MIDPSNIWLKALIIEMASCPLIYVWMVIYVNIQIFIGRNTEGNKKLALWMIIVVIFVPFIFIPYAFAIRLGDFHYGEKHHWHDWAFLIWVTVLLILSLTPSALYFFKRGRDLKRVGFWRQ